MQPPVVPGSGRTARLELKLRGQGAGGAPRMLPAPQALAGRERVERALGIMWGDGRNPEC